MPDVHMLVMLGGRERTNDEFQALLAASKFKLKCTLSLPSITGRPPGSAGEAVKV
jgi:hypothetical protein